MKRRLLFGALLFFLTVLLLTRLDFLVNKSLYAFGLRYDEGWYVEYSLLYALLYQAVIVMLALYTKSLRFVAFTEVFVLTSSQDLVYFGLWQGGFPGIQWAWTPFFHLFGTWTTANQLMLSFSANAFVATALALASLKNFSAQVKVRQREDETLALKFGKAEIGKSSSS